MTDDEIAKDVARQLVGLRVGDRVRVTHNTVSGAGRDVPVGMTGKVIEVSPFGHSFLLPMPDEDGWLSVLLDTSPRNIQRFIRVEDLEHE